MIGSNILEAKLSQDSKLKIGKFQNPEIMYYDVCPRDSGTRVPRDGCPRMFRLASPETTSTQWPNKMEHSYGWSTMQEFKRIE